MNKLTNADSGITLPIGTSRSLCTGCGEYFKSVSGFDKHRVGQYPERTCAYPSVRGLALNSQGLWAAPMSADVLARRKGEKS
jgi:hypothetical protein